MQTRQRSSERHELTHHNSSFLRASVGGVFPCLEDLARPSTRLPMTRPKQLYQQAICLVLHHRRCQPCPSCRFLCWPRERRLVLPQQSVALPSLSPECTAAISAMIYLGGGCRRARVWQSGIQFLTNICLHALMRVSRWAHADRLAIHTCSDGTTCG